MISKEHALIFVRRQTVTNAVFVDSNVPETDYPVWDENETYAEGDEVIVLADHGVYVSSDDDNQGNDPLTRPDKWTRRENTNRWKVFDDSLSSRTRHPNLITYRLQPGRAIGQVAFMNLRGATTIRVEIEDPVYGVVMDETQHVGSTTPAPSWWQFFFGDRTTGRAQAVFEVPATYPEAELRITITGSAALGVGMIVFGQQRRFGYGVQYGARAGIVTYSTVQRDIDGAATIRKRPFAKRSTLNLALPNDEVDQLYNYLAQIESEPVLMIASKRYETFTGYGIIKNFEIVIPNPSVSDCSIEFDGMT